jgi:hypothetical protein
MQFHLALTSTVLLRAPLNKRLQISSLLFAMIGQSYLHAAESGETAEYQSKLRRTKPIRLISSPDVRAAGSYREIPLANAPESPLSERVSDILQKQTGVQVNRAGAPGTQSVLAIRGMSPDQVEYFIEGIPLPRPLTTPPNLESLPLPLFDSVEIYPSFVPSHLPGANIGGALNFRLTKPEGEAPRYLTQVSQNSLLGTSIAAGRQSGGSLNFFSFEQSRNRYSYISNNGTVENPADDRALTRKNEDFTRVGYTGFGVLAQGKWQIAGLADLYHSERGVPGVQNLPIEAVRRSEQRLSGAVKASRPLNETTSVQLIASTSLDRSHLSDQNREIIAAAQQLSLSPQIVAGASLGYRTQAVDAAVNTRGRYQSIAIDRGEIANRYEGQTTLNAAYDTDLFRVAGQVGITLNHDRAAQNAFYASREISFNTTGYSASGLVAIRPLAVLRTDKDRPFDRSAFGNLRPGHERVSQSDTVRAVWRRAVRHPGRIFTQRTRDHQRCGCAWRCQMPRRSCLLMAQRSLVNWSQRFYSVHTKFFAHADSCQRFKRADRGHRKRSAAESARKVLAFAALYLSRRTRLWQYSLLSG